MDERQNLTNKVEQAELARHVIRRKITGESLDKFFEKTKMPCFTCVVPVEKKTNAQLIISQAFETVVCTPDGNRTHINRTGICHSIH